GARVKLPAENLSSCGGNIFVSDTRHFGAEGHPAREDEKDLCARSPTLSRESHGGGTLFLTRGPAASDAVPVHHVFELFACRSWRIVGGKSEGNDGGDRPVLRNLEL